MPETAQSEVDRNYDAFRAMLPTIIREHRGKFALMKSGRIVGYYSSAADARSAGDLAFGGELFSIQHVTDAPAGLGFYTDAMFGIQV